MSAASTLFYKNARQLANTSRIIRTQSSFKMWFVLCFAAACEIGLFLLFYDGFRYLTRMGGVGIMMIDRLFSLFFFGMGLMLIMSGIVTSYASLFRSDEVPFLLSRPFRISEIVSYKFVESTFLSSWAFSFIIVPFIGAYAWHEKMTVLLAIWTFLFSVPFLIVCSGVGTVVTMLLVRWFPTGIGRVVKILAAILGITLCVFFSRLSREAYNLSTEPQLNLSRLVPGLNLASNPLWPSWWVSEGIMALARQQWLRGVMLLGVMLSTAMAVFVCVEWIGEQTFYEGWQRVVISSGRGRRAPRLLRSLDKMLFFISSDVRAMIMKDIRMFLRDPMQWSQVLIFFGLLALYFSNLRSFNYHVLPANWRNTIAFLNVFSVSAVMCSLSSRFIYPQLSLEGQGFWIIGLSPVTMTRVLVTKFLLALVGMLTVSVSLMLLSANMLAASFATTAVAVSVTCAMSFAVCGLSTGLGAIFLDLRQRNPSAIVSGFGGTLNLVLSLGFMLAAILPFAFVFHLHTMGRLGDLELRGSLVLAGVWLLAITMLTTFIPLRLGAHSLARREF
jgi:ABC-2 type transport system permease protein